MAHRHVPINTATTTTTTTTASTAKVFILLVCLASVTLTFGNFNVSRDCRNKGQTCGDVMDVFMAKRGQATHLNLTAICAATEQHRECLGRCRGEIQSTPIVGLGMKIRQYLCDPSRRTQVEAVLNSDCVRDGSMDSNFDTVMDGCMDDFGAEAGQERIAAVFYFGNRRRAAELCPAATGFIRCLADGVQGYCGDQVMPAVNDVLGIVFGDIFTVYLPPCLS